MTREYNLLLVLLLAIGACEKETPNSSSPPEKSLRSADKRPVQQQIESVDVRSLARSTLLRKDLISPGVLEESIESIHSLASRLSNKENLPYGAAINEIYITLAQGRNMHVFPGLKGVFGEAILLSPQGVAPTVAELPAGELRRVAIASILGASLTVEELRNIHSAMPESIDRYEIAGEVATRSFLESGATSSLDFIKTLSIRPEMEHALNVLSSTMSSSAQLGGRKPTKAEIDMVISYAKTSNSSKQVEFLEKIFVEDRL